MWHRVPHRMDSYQETTGTGFITHYLPAPSPRAYLPEAAFRRPVERAAAALAGFVTRDGTVFEGERGARLWPAVGRQHYLHRDAPPGESHTVGTVAYGPRGAPPCLTAKDRSGPVAHGVEVLRRWQLLSHSLRRHAADLNLDEPVRLARPRQFHLEVVAA